GEGIGARAEAGGEDAERGRDRRGESELLGLDREVPLDAGEAAREEGAAPRELHEAALRGGARVGRHREDAADAAGAGVPRGREARDDREPAGLLLEVGELAFDRLELAVEEARARPQVRVLGEDARDLPAPAQGLEPEDRGDR